MTSRSCRRGSEKRSTADRPVPPSRLQRTTGQYKAVYRCMVRLIVSPPAWMGYRKAVNRRSAHITLSPGAMFPQMFYRRSVAMHSANASPLCRSLLPRRLPPRRAGITTWSWLHLRALLLLLLLHPRANQEPPGRKFFVWPKDPFHFFLPGGPHCVRPRVRQSGQCSNWYSGGRTTAAAALPNLAPQVWMHLGQASNPGSSRAC